MSKTDKSQNQKVQRNMLKRRLHFLTDKNIIFICLLSDLNYMVLTPSEQNYNVLERPHLIQTHNLNFSQKLCYYSKLNNTF